jgi:hypothetical protein
MHALPNWYSAGLTVAHLAMVGDGCGCARRPRNEARVASPPPSLLTSLNLPAERLASR